MKKMREKTFSAAARLTDLPRPKWWGHWIRFFKTFEVCFFKGLEVAGIYRPEKLVVCLPTLSTKHSMSLQAVVYNGTEDEILGFNPRRFLLRFLKGVPDIEMFEWLRFEMETQGQSVRAVQGSTETRGIVHMHVTWHELEKETALINPKAIAVETLLGRMTLGKYTIYPAPVFYLNEKVRWIIVSDIDDTIKDSKIGETTGLKQILRGVFKGNYYQYDAIGGMAELYQKLAKQGCLIAYVTSTPYQLAPFLLKFLRERGFPEGPVFPRWIGYGRFGHKWRTIQRILLGTDAQKCLLIGDSGEQDLQIYRRVASTPQFKEKIGKIYIRELAGTTLPDRSGDVEYYYKEIQALENDILNMVK